jgi:acyl-coenzyme A thioesterase PaaI-like protein
MLDSPESAAPDWPKQVIKTGEWAGWSIYTSDPFEAHAGPFYHRRADNGLTVCAMRAETLHMNGGGYMHGGAIMTFADFALFAIAQPILKGAPAVTATFNGEFVGSVPLGSLVECTGEVIRDTRSLVFMRGLITTDGAPVMSFSAVLKKIQPSN